MIVLLNVFRTTTNPTGENRDKKQNTFPYTLQVKVMEVCLVGSGDDELPVKKSVDNAF